MTQNIAQLLLPVGSHCITAKLLLIYSSISFTNIVSVIPDVSVLKNISSLLYVAAGLLKQCVCTHSEIFTYLRTNLILRVVSMQAEQWILNVAQ